MRLTTGAVFDRLSLQHPPHLVSPRHTWEMQREADDRHG